MKPQRIPQSTKDPLCFGVLAEGPLGDRVARRQWGRGSVLGNPHAVRPWRRKPPLHSITSNRGEALR
ncbi:Hypothetical predicted protein [Podarcis lilfordi]|uniref:Uncharacterized protein n=1 Tax=Podarcis lilfordi TaxID=74358 RepID=A0AA35PBP4_9SAUR|nr:Hypothetical predicted protein [Podarcis lilfordi]